MYFSVFQFSDSIASEECPVGHFHFQQSCYKVNNTKLPRDEAARACGPDGHLADITSPEEQEFIATLLNATVSGDAWFGLFVNPENNETLTWSNGLPFIPESWQHIVQDESVFCIRLREDSSGYTWQDRDCGLPFRFICEFEGIWYIVEHNSCM